MEEVLDGIYYRVPQNGALCCTEYFEMKGFGKWYVQEDSADLLPEANPKILMWGCPLFLEDRNIFIPKMEGP